MDSDLESASGGEKPSHLELITKEELLSTIKEDLKTMLEAIEAERSYIVDEHAHNSGTAYRLAEMYSTYAEKIQAFIRLRSASEEKYNFIRDTKTGHLGFKHHRQPWGTMSPLGPEKSAPDGYKHDHGPSATDGAYR